jgi:hypothetical protein
MDKHELAVIRGEEASRILKSEVFAQAFADVRAGYLKTWEGLPTSDGENARDIHRRLKCLTDVKKALEYHIDTGKLAQKELTGREKAGQVIRRTLNHFTNPEKV